MLNTTTLIGRLVNKPEPFIPDTGVENKFCRFTLAVNSFNKSRVAFFPCIAFKKQAEILVAWGKKGSLIAVQGRIETSKNVSSDKSVTYHNFNLICNTVELLDKREEGKGNG